MFSRRKFLMAAGALSLMPLAASADDRGFLDLISSIKDRSEREYFERHRDDARWDGRYYYDRKTNRRYSRDDWRKELRRRHQEERRRGARPRLRRRCLRQGHKDHTVLCRCRKQDGLEKRTEKAWRCVIIANRCVIIGIQAKSFTEVNSCRPHPQSLALYQF